MSHKNLVLNKQHGVKLLSLSSLHNQRLLHTLELTSLIKGNAHHQLQTPLQKPLCLSLRPAASHMHKIGRNTPEVAI